MTDLLPYQPAVEGEAVDTKDFIIHNLERRLKERDDEIRTLRERLRAVQFYADIRLKQYREEVTAAIKGDLKMPALTIDHGHV